MRWREIENMDVVTGSFGYIGKYITRALLERGHAVKTITTQDPNGKTLFSVLVGEWLRLWASL